MTPEEGAPGGQPGYPPPGYPPPPGYQQPGGAQSYYPPGGYPPGYYPPGGRGARNGMGTTALVLGLVAIVSWFFAVGIVLGLLAVIFGFVARGRVRRGEASNGGAALAGIILGALSVVAGVVLFAWIFSQADFANYTDCLRHAETRAEQLDCRQQFESELG
jgi:hypothetical protein